MKKTKEAMIFLALTTFILAACSPVNTPAAESHSPITEASDKFAELKNGKFVYTKTSEGEGEKVEGIFLNREGSSEWYIRNTLIEDSQTDPTASEFIKTGDKLFRRFLMEVEENSFLKEDPELQAGSWHVVPENAIWVLDDISEYLSLLQVDQVEEGNMESIAVTEEGQQTRHHLIYSQQYLRDLKRLNVWSLRLELLAAKMEDAEGYNAQMLEHMLKAMKNRDYTHLEKTWGIDEEGMLTYALQKSITNELIDEEVAVIPVEIGVELLEYNQPAIETAFPSVEPER